MAETRHPLENSPFCLMGHVLRRSSPEFEEGLAEVGLIGAEFLVLADVFAFPGSLPAEVARRVVMTPQYVGELADSLESRGLLERQGERGRGRRTHLHLTAAGGAALTRSAPALLRVGESIAASMPAQERPRFLADLRAAAGLEQFASAEDDTDDLVVLVDEAGEPIGTAPRLSVHGATTPRHLAFSLYLFDGQGRVLLTRRSLAKLTWPGVWSNACCGHPRPGEDLAGAVVRRTRQELGLDVSPTLALPDFSYRATDASGVVENELCPVFVATVPPGTVPKPDADEVAEWAWQDWSGYVAACEHLPAVLSPWTVEQVAQLRDRVEATGALR